MGILYIRRYETDDDSIGENKMYEILMNDEIIEKVKRDVIESVSHLMKNDLVEVILYGSCARGDYTEDSDIDIALLTRCDRMEVKKYDEELANLATELAMKYFTVVNFVCLPYQEFTEKRTWYAYFRNIEKDGVILYG